MKNHYKSGVVFALLTFLLPSIGFAQKYASVVELFTNTGDVQAVDAINAMSSNSGLSDAEFDNHVYIQYHADTTVSGWTDLYVNAKATARFQDYLGQGLISGLSDVAKNGEASTDSPVYNSDPSEKEIYYNGAKFMALQFVSYDVQNDEIAVRFALSTKYTSGKSLHIFALEDNIDLSITGGPNSGSTLELNNVFRNERVVPADVYTDTVHLSLPSGTDPANVKVVGYMRDDANYEIVSATRGFKLSDYLNVPGTTFAVVENFINTGCYGGPPANSSMFDYALQAEASSDNEVMVQLHIGQTYGNWSDVYKLPLNADRYDTYSWDMGIIAGLAAVAKNGIRYKAHSWNNCSPVEKVESAFVEVSPASFSNNTLTVDYELSGALHPYDRVYFYVVERGITVHVTGGEIPGTTLNMNNVARVAQFRDASAALSDTVQLHIPQDVVLDSARVLAYIQNDRTYEITGGTKGFKLDNISSAGLGVPQGATYGFTLYPNPVDSDVSILFSDSFKGGAIQIEIYDVKGALCFTEQMDITPSLLVLSDLNLVPGVYTVSINGVRERLVVR